MTPPETIPSPDTSSPQTGVIVAETLYWTFLGLHALIPTVWQPLVTINGAVIPAAICGLIALAFIVPLLCLSSLRFRPITPLVALIAMALMAAWGLVLVGWQGQPSDRVDLTYRCLEPVAALAAAVVGIFLGQATGRVRTFGIIQRATLFMVFVGTVYGLKSLFAAGLSLDVIRDQEQRGRGPLYSPAVGHLVLLPALGAAIFFASASVERYRRIAWAAVAAGALFAIVAMGSRGALLSLAFGGVVLALKRPVILQRPVPILLVLFALGGIFVGSLQVADRTRLTTLSEPYRLTSYATAWRILSDDPARAIVGRGPGAVYQWLHIDMSVLGLPQGITAVGLRRVSTPWGESLNNPHCLLLLWTVNMGVLGFGVFWLIITSLIVAVIRAQGPMGIGLSCALLATTPVFFVDVALGSALFPFASLWWLFFSGMYTANHHGH